MILSMSKLFLRDMDMPILWSLFRLEPRVQRIQDSVQSWIWSLWNLGLTMNSRKQTRKETGLLSWEVFPLVVIVLLCGRCIDVLLIILVGFNPPWTVTIGLLAQAKDIKIWKYAMVNENHNDWLLSLKPPIQIITILRNYWIWKIHAYSAFQARSYNM